MRLRNTVVIQKREGSAGAFSLRGPASVLGLNRHAYGYDIGSSSDRDPISEIDWPVCAGC